MKRTLFPASALVLVLTACGAGAQPAPRVTNDPPHSARPGVKAIAAARERAAARTADRILDRVVLPSGAIRLARPPAGLRTANHGVSVLREFTYRHRVWRVHEPYADVVEFVEHRALPGFELGASGGAPESLEFDRPPHSGRPAQRLVDVKLVVGRHGWTYFRVDAGAAWIYPRSPEEIVPRATRSIDVTAPHVSLHVTDPARVERIRRWFDALNVVQPLPDHVVVGCHLVLSPDVNLVFRSARGDELARALMSPQPADGCGPIEFSIAGEKQTPLIDDAYGYHAFVYRLQRLLDVRLVEPA